MILKCNLVSGMSNFFETMTHTIDIKVLALPLPRPFTLSKLNGGCLHIIFCYSLKTCLLRTPIISIATQMRF